MKLCKTYSQRLKLSYLEKVKLETLSMEHRQLYNHQLAWLKEQGKLDFKALNSEYVRFRHEQGLTIASKSAQNTNRSLEANIKSYLTLKKTDLSARFPSKFKSWKFGFTAFEYDWNNGSGGFKLDGDKLVIRHVGLELQLGEYLLKAIKGKDVKLIRFVGRDDDIYLQVIVGSEVNPLPEANWVSIDPGLKSLMTCVTSTGETFSVPRKLDRIGEQQLDALRSKRDKKTKYSRRYKKLSKTFRRKTRKHCNGRRDYQHKVTKATVDRLKELDVSTVIYGDIQTKSLTKSKSATTGLNKATQGRGDLARVKTFLAYKAAEAGMSVVLQNEAYTSRTNCLTGELFASLSLADRELELLPDLVIDRDVNGAVNIAQKALRGKWSASEDFIRSLRKLDAVLVE